MRVVAAAADLFYRDGVRAVGVDRLVEEAGVAKATFYDHFPTKNDLVLAYLRQWDGAWRSWFLETLETTVRVTPSKLLGVFDVLHSLFADGEYRGCAFARAISDVGDEVPEVLGIAREHKAAVRNQLEMLASEQGVLATADLAEQLLLLIDGAMITAAREQSPQAAITAKSVATILVGKYIALPDGA